VLRRKRYSDQHEFALNAVGSREVLHGDHVHEAVEVFLDLFREVGVGATGKRDARHLRIRRFGDAQAGDIVAAAAEHPGHPGEDAGLVVDEDGDDVFANIHVLSLSYSFCPSNISTLEHPGGMMG